MESAICVAMESGAGATPVPDSMATQIADSMTGHRSVAKTKEQPVHKVCFDQPFWLDVTEVSNATFKKFGGVASKQPDPKRFPEQAGWDADTMPRLFMNWEEATAFCKKRGARLLTEAEWEYAARGPDGLIFPWGNTWTPDMKVLGTSDGPSPVGSFPQNASWVGVLDLMGNVYQWVSDWSAPYSANDQVNPTGPKGSPNFTQGTVAWIGRGLRGGSFSNGDALNGAFDRAAMDPVNPFFDFSDTGIRCAKSY